MRLIHHIRSKCRKYSDLQCRKFHHYHRRGLHQNLDSHHCRNLLPQRKANLDCQLGKNHQHHQRHRCQGQNLQYHLYNHRYQHHWHRLKSNSIHLFDRDQDVSQKYHRYHHRGLRCHHLCSHHCRGLLRNPMSSLRLQSGNHLEQGQGHRRYHHRGLQCQHLCNHLRRGQCLPGLIANQELLSGKGQDSNPRRHRYHRRGLHWSLDSHHCRNLLPERKSNRCLPLGTFVHWYQGYHRCHHLCLRESLDNRLHHGQ